jgi:hypothetical protein
MGGSSRVDISVAVYVVCVYVDVQAATSAAVRLGIPDIAAHVIHGGRFPAPTADAKADVIQGGGPFPHGGPPRQPPGRLAKGGEATQAVLDIVKVKRPEEAAGVVKGGAVVLGGVLAVVVYLQLGVMVLVVMAELVILLPVVYSMMVEVSTMVLGGRREEVVRVAGALHGVVIVDAGKVVLLVSLAVEVMATACC